MKRFAAVCLLALGACDSSTDLEVVARVGWRFDYRDWTKPLCECLDLSQSACESTADCNWDGSACQNGNLCTVPDVRGCSNQPESSGGAPAYPAVEDVRLQVVDPESGDVRRDIELPCSDGDGAPLLEIRALPKREQLLTLMASADGAELYSQPVAFSIDLSSLVEEVFTLRTLTGDVEMELTYPGADVGTCPDNAASATYAFTVVGESTPALTGTVDTLCEPPDLFGVSLARRLYVRSIPTAPTTSGVPQFEVQVEVHNSAGDPVYCGETTRNITPGRNEFTDDLPVSAGACPP